MAEHMDVDDLLAIYVVLSLKRKRKRSIWTKNWLLKREQLGHTNLLQELLPYPEDVYSFLRMDEDSYRELLDLVRPSIEKETTVLRSPINAHQRLTATLRYLATGDTYQDLKFSTCISAQALSNIIPETCNAIYQALSAEYLKFPARVEEWLNIAQGFEMIWQFPNCLGAIGGKHIAISPPHGSGSYYYNYKGFNSMVLMAIANANYELVYVNFGTNGRMSDGGVIDQTDFYQKLKQGDLNLPGLNLTNGLPYVFISDEVFGLRPDLLKPYNVQALDDKKRVFNYRLFRARRIVENVFGILVARFGVLGSVIKLKPENIDSVVLACCALHNFLRKKLPQNYTPLEQLDREDPVTHNIEDGLRVQGPNVTNIAQTSSKNPTQEAKAVRDKFTVYFDTIGRVSWQDKYALGQKVQLTFTTSSKML